MDDNLTKVILAIVGLFATGLVVKIGINIRDNRRKKIASIRQGGISGHSINNTATIIQSDKNE